MKKPLKDALILFLSIQLFIFCSKFPITGRKHFNMIPDNEMLATGIQEYHTFLMQNHESANPTK
jgi:hypothetical protein